jgi:hypothetical protein
VRITIENKRLRRWLWFIGIYTASVMAFGAVTGFLALLVPK